MLEVSLILRSKDNMIAMLANRELTTDTQELAVFVDSDRMLIERFPKNAKELDEYDC